MEGNKQLKQSGMLKAIHLSRIYSKLSLSKREEVRQERLRKLVRYAQDHSPYYQELYANRRDDFKLTDLPVTNKVMMMENFDDWVTDRNIKYADILKFTENPDNIGRYFLNKYLVFTTSGSTGSPSVVLYDKSAYSIMGALGLLRSYARKEDLKAMIMKGGKSAGVFATGGFYLGNSSVRNKLLAMPWKKNKFMVTSILKPIDEIVKELNLFKPVMLGGYPTALSLLAEEQKKGNLHISPTIVMTGGEYLSNEIRTLLKETFHCYVQTNYSCTEGGMVACECVKQHLHINDDWVIMEPVDKNNNPVLDGEQADKWLLTNLSNYTQPLIRFEITDRVIFHREACPCHNPAPWIEIEGRTDDILHFQGEKQTIRIAPLALYALLKEIHEIKRFQLILKKNNQLELRIVCDSEKKREEAFLLAKTKLISFLYENKIKEVSIKLSEEEPKRHEKSGKFKHVYQVDEKR